MVILEGETDPPGSITLLIGDEERDVHHVSSNVGNQERNARSADHSRTRVGISDPCAVRAVDLEEGHGGDASKESNTLQPQGEFRSFYCERESTRSCWELLPKFLGDASSKESIRSSPEDSLRSRVGAMSSKSPCDLPLDIVLTIDENFRFIRRLHGDPKNQVEQRIRVLSELLQLPDGRLGLRNCLKSEKDRVSLAAALIPSPGVLLLEKPTVNQNHELKERIWDLLRTLSRDEGVKVLLFTDDFEEAAQADDVTIVVNGGIMAQDSPDRLLKEFQCDTLEGVLQTLRKERKLLIVEDRGSLESASVVTKTCVMEVGAKKLPISDAPAYGKHTTASKRVPFVSINETPQRGVLSVSWYRILILLLKDLNLFKIFSHFWLRLFTCPCVVLLGFALAFGMRNCFLSQLPVGVIKSNATSTLVDPFFASLEMGSSSLVPSWIDPSPQRPLCSLDEALQGNQTCAVMRVGGNSSSASHYQFVVRYKADENNATIETVLNVDIDANSQTTRFYLHRAIILAFEELRLMTRILHARTASSVEIDSRFDDPLFGSRSVSHAEFLAPSLLIYTTFALVGILTTWQARNAIEDIITGRYRTAGVLSLEIVISKLSFLLLTLFGQITIVLLCLGVLNWIDLLPVRGSLGLAGVLILTQGLLGIAVGMFYSAVVIFFDKKRWTFYFTASVWLLLVAAMWASYGSRGVLTGMSYGIDIDFLPTTSTESLRYILYRGWGLEKDVVSKAFTGLATRIGVFSFVATILISLLPILYDCRPCEYPECSEICDRIRKVRHTKKGVASRFDRSLEW